MRKGKQIPLSEARRNFSAIVDGVTRTGKPVTILRHGKPAVIIASPAEYRERVVNNGKWHLAGSIKIKKGVDVEKAIDELSKNQAEAWELSQKRLAKEFRKPKP